MLACPLPPATPPPRAHQVYLPFFKRFMVTDKAAFAAKVNQILGWGVEVIVPCHGEVVRSGASQALRETLL